MLIQINISREKSKICLVMPSSVHAQAFARVTYLRYFSRALPLRAKLWSLQQQQQRIFRQIDVCFVRSAIDALHPSQRLTTWHDTDRKISLI